MKLTVKPSVPKKYIQQLGVRYSILDEQGNEVGKGWGREEAIWYARMMLLRDGGGGKVVAPGDGIYTKKVFKFEPCEHETAYDMMGGDVCLKCGACW